MDDSQTAPLWLLPLVPVMWLLVTGMMGVLGGWYELARLYRDPEGRARAPLESFWMASLSLRGWSVFPATYRNGVIVEVSRTGLHLRLWLPFRFGHPPLFIPWTHIQRIEPRPMLFLHRLVIYPAGIEMRILLHGGAAAAVEEAWRRLAAGAARPVVA